MPAALRATPKKQVLILDDDRAALEAMGAAEEREFHVFAVRDIATATHALDRETINLVILDAVLHQESGLDFLPRLRETSDVPVLLISGYGTKEMVLGGLRARASDYLDKPFNATELLEKARELIAQGPRPSHVSEARGREVNAPGRPSHSLRPRSLRSFRDSPYQASPRRPAILDPYPLRSHAASGTHDPPVPTEMLIRDQALSDPRVIFVNTPSMEGSITPECLIAHSNRRSECQRFDGPLPRSLVEGICSTADRSGWMHPATHPWLQRTIRIFPQSKGVAYGWRRHGPNQ